MNAEAGVKSGIGDGAAETLFAETCAYLTPGAPALKPRQIGLVPGAEVPLLEVVLPAALRGHAREQVAERQIRDALAEGLDAIEIRPFQPPDQQAGWSRVLVADRARLEAWRRLAGAGCRAVLPDYLALPAGAGIWTLARTGDTVLARLGPGDGFSASYPVAQRLLQRALETAVSAPEAVFSPGPLGPELETLFASHDIPVAADEAALKALDLSPPRFLTHGELGCDLRRDPRAARAALKARVLPWRWPVLVSLVAAGLWAGAQMLATTALKEQTDQTRAATVQTVRDGFVPSGPVLDIRTQVARALAEARLMAGTGQAASPLDLLGLAADVITARGGRPDYINYTVADGLSAVVRVKDFAAADALAEALREAGLSITVVESRVSEADEGVRTELRIAPPERSEPGG